MPSVVALTLAAPSGPSPSNTSTQPAFCRSASVASTSADRYPATPSSEPSSRW